jgi:hypothetical protein
MLAGHSSSESNLHHVSPVEIRHLPKTEALGENRRTKTKESALLADTEVGVPR